MTQPPGDEFQWMQTVLLIDRLVSSIQRVEQESPHVTEIRAEAARGLARLLPMALDRARQKDGSPALLRLILRSIKSL